MIWFGSVIKKIASYMPCAGLFMLIIPRKRIRRYPSRCYSFPVSGMQYTISEYKIKTWIFCREPYIKLHR